MYLWYFQNAAANDITLYGGGKKIYTAAEWSEVVGTEKNKITAEFELSRRAMDTALSLYENFEKTYIAHVLLEMIEIELTEQKRFMGITAEALKQLTSLIKNAQKTQGAK